MVLQVGVGSELGWCVLGNLWLRGIHKDGVSCWSCCWLCKVLDSLDQNVLWMTTLYTWWYLLNRLYACLYHNWLLALSGHSGGIIAWSITRRYIVLDELFLQLSLLLSLPSDLLLTQIFMTVIRSVSVEINRGSLPCEHITLLLRRCDHHLLNWVLNYDFWHVLSECWCLLVWIRSRIPAWSRIVSASIRISIVKRLSRI